MKWRQFTLGALLAALVAVAAACGRGGGAATSPAGDGLTQKDNGEGSVTVTATWSTADHLANDDKLRAAAAGFVGQDVVLLHVTMNTHSVDLSKYDLGKLSALDAGQGPQAPVGWKKFSDDSHHLEAVIGFRRPVTAAGATATLTIREVGGVAERRLAWTPAPS